MFNTADGYAAVWHLNRNCADASCNKNDGVACSATDTAGIIGYAKKFNGADSIKMAGFLGSPSNVTLSAWAQLDTMGAQGSEVISLGDAVLIRMDYFLPSYGTMGAMHLSTLPTIRPIIISFPVGFWQKPDGIILRLPSMRRSMSNRFTSTAFALNNNMNSVIDYTGVGQNTFIGKHGNGKTSFNFNGRIDEVRVCRTAMSADYIKLCYMNQKGTDALVVFK